MTFSTEDIAIIQAQLNSTHPELVCLALTNDDKRLELRNLIKDKVKIVKTDEDAEQVTREIVGTGIIEEIISTNQDVTDIKFDGTQLTVAGITSFKKIVDDRINEQYVQRLMQKFSTALKVEFSRKNPIINGVLGNMRLNAVHSANTTGGTTFSIRIVRPRLALTQENFHLFAPPMILELYKQMVALYSNILMAGRTGTGKTELQKLGLTFTKGEKEEIGVIQDEPELFSKVLNPDKSIYEWLTGNGVDHNMLIKAAMRNNFRWIIVSEIIDDAAYGLYQAVTSGHAVMTSLHSKTALLMPKRAAQLAKFAPEAATMDVEMLERDFKEMIDFGFYVEKETINGVDYRYLSEIAAFSPENSYLIFKQTLNHKGEFEWFTTTLPESFKQLLELKGLPMVFKENQQSSQKTFEVEEVAV